MENFRPFPPLADEHMSRVIRLARAVRRPPPKQCHQMLEHIPHGWRMIARALALAGTILLGLGTSLDAAPAAKDAWSLGDLTIEQLMNEPVTTVSKREQRLSDAAAAVTVLSSDDLRRSGTTTIADSLRLVPGVQVAAMGSGTWAVTARGFNSQFANKLQVMMDGRTVYLPLFSGVLWDAQQSFLDDVDRIEIIRGPGATVWGANAVNGVINVVSKSARDTQGGLIFGGGGNVDLAMGGARYGGQLGESTYYRVYGNYLLRDDYRLANGRPADDAWDLGKIGFRLDHYAMGGGQLTWQGDAFTGNVDDRRGDQYGFNTLGRWSRAYSDRTGYEIQLYLDRFHRRDLLTDYGTQTADLSLQQTFGLGSRHDFIWGFGYRASQSELNEGVGPAVTVIDHENRLNLFSAFVQDEVTVVPDVLTATFGTKVEHNDITDWEVQPSVRAVFRPAEKHTVWAAISRAVRTPTESEAIPFINYAVGSPIVGPGGGLYLPTFVANPRVESEDLLAYELGYRVQPQARLSIDAAVFYHDYHHLIGHNPTGFVPGSPLGVMTIEPQNTLQGKSFGAEITLTVAPADGWRVSASYSALKLELHGAPVSEAEQFERNAPTHQFSLRSSYDFSRFVSLDAQLRYVDNVDQVPAYLTGDVRISWRPREWIELSLAGTNLLDDRHPEQASILGSPRIEVPRGIFAKVSCRF